MSEDADGRRGSGEDHGTDRPDINIQIDREHFSVAGSAATGETLRALPDPDIPQDRDLYLVVPGGQDVKIELTTSVMLKSGMRFFTAPGQINPGAPIGSSLRGERG